MTIQLNRLWAAPHDFPSNEMLAVGDESAKKDIMKIESHTRRGIENNVVRYPRPPVEPDEPSPEEHLDTLLECEDYRALFSWILDDPHDLGRRLVMADWLEDHGHPRAEFIRDQVELLQAARRDINISKGTGIIDRDTRVRKAVKKYGKKWIESDVRHIIQAGLTRERDPNEVQEIAGTIGSRYQLLENGFVTAPTLSVYQYAAYEMHHGHFAHVRLEGVSEEGLSMLFVRGTFKKLRSLGISSLAAYTSAETIVTYLANAETARNIEALDLRGLGLTNVHALSRSPCLKNLRHVDLSDNVITDEGIGSIINEGWNAELCTLDLRRNHCSEDRLSELMSSRMLNPEMRIYGKPSIRHGSSLNTAEYEHADYRMMLHAPGDPVLSLQTETMEQVARCVSAGKAENLLSLTVDNQGKFLPKTPSMHPIWFDVIQENRGWRQLRSLALRNCALEDWHVSGLDPRVPLGKIGENAGKSMLHFSPLLKLDLSINKITVNGLKRLQTVFGFQDLQELTLDCNPIGDDGAAYIATEPSFAASRQISLRHCGITGTGIESLLHSKTLPERGLCIAIDTDMIPEDLWLEWHTRFGSPPAS